MKTQITTVFALLVFITAACGGGGGKSPVDPTPGESVELTSEAYDLLEEGSITESMGKYDEALAADETNASAAFGAALARMILLSESDPTNSILTGLGQKNVKATDLIGPAGYGAALDQVNAVDITLDGYEGPFFGTASTSSYSYNTRQNGRQIKCSFTSVYLSFYNADNSVRGEISFNPLIEATENGEVTSLTLTQGETVDVYQDLDHPCTSNPVTIWVQTDNEDGSTWDDSTTGTMTLNSFGADFGETVELTLNNVSFPIGFNDARRLTLNGSIRDILSPDPVKKDYLPFFEAPPGVSTAAQVLGMARDNLTVREIQDSLAEYVPLLEKIAELLAQADQDDSFQFIIPKGLYFGTADMPVNRIDLKAIRASAEFAIAGIYLAGAWDFPIEAGTLYAEWGELLITQEALVDQLNRSFGLRSDHKLIEAQGKFAEGLDLLLETSDIFETVTVDGILEKDPLTVGGFAELEGLIAVAQSSLGGAQPFPYVSPAVDLNLNGFFNTPPDASKIDFDPFVLEDGEIKPVEAFFEKLLEGTVNLDLAKRYKPAFSAINSTFADAVFDEFKHFIVAGEKL